MDFLLFLDILEYLILYNQLVLEMLMIDFSSLLDTYSSNDCVEVYCLGKFIEMNAWGLCTRKGIALCKEEEFMAGVEAVMAAARRAVR